MLRGLRHLLRRRRRLPAKMNIAYVLDTVSGPFHPLGGAVDSIVVKQEDGTYKSTPFYVRFGKFQGVLKRRDKIVHVAVNGVDAASHMYMDHRGQCYFLIEKEVEGPDGEPDAEFMFSPPSCGPDSSGDEGKGELSRRSSGDLGSRRSSGALEESVVKEGLGTLATSGEKEGTVAASATVAALSQLAAETEAASKAPLGPEAAPKVGRKTSPLVSRSTSAPSRANKKPVEVELRSVLSLPDKPVEVGSDMRSPRAEEETQEKEQEALKDKAQEEKEKAMLERVRAWREVLQKAASVVDHKPILPPLDSSLSKGTSEMAALQESAEKASWGWGSWFTKGTPEKRESHSDKKDAEPDKKVNQSDNQSDKKDNQADKKDNQSEVQPDKAMTEPKEVVHGFQEPVKSDLPIPELPSEQATQASIGNEGTQKRSLFRSLFGSGTSSVAPVPDHDSKGMSTAAKHEQEQGSLDKKDEDIAKLDKVLSSRMLQAPLATVVEEEGSTSVEPKSSDPDFKDSTVKLSEGESSSSEELKASEELSSPKRKRDNEVKETLQEVEEVEADEIDPRDLKKVKLHRGEVREIGKDGLGKPVMVRVASDGSLHVSDSRGIEASLMMAELESELLEKEQAGKEKEAEEALKQSPVHLWDGSVLSEAVATSALLSEKEPKHGEGGLSQSFREEKLRNSHERFERLMLPEPETSQPATLEVKEMVKEVKKTGSAPMPIWNAANYRPSDNTWGSSVPISSPPFGQFPSFASLPTSPNHILSAPLEALYKPSLAAPKSLSSETSKLSGGAPAGKGDAPAGKGDAPAGKGDPPAGKGDAPAGKGDASAARESAPAVTEHEPAVNDGAPAVKEDVPAGSKTEPAATGAVPAVSEAPPATTESAAAVSQDAPAASEPVPPVTEASPAATQPLPAVSGPAPAVTEPLPAVEDGLPPVEDALLPPVKDALAPVTEPLPAVKDALLPPVTIPKPIELDSSSSSPPLRSGDQSPVEVPDNSDPLRALALSEPDPEPDQPETSKDSAELASEEPRTGLELSLCRHLLVPGMGSEAAEAAFESERVSVEQFGSNPRQVAANERLVVRVGGQYHPWAVAAPTVLGMLAYGQVVPPLLALDGAIPIEKLQGTDKSKSSSGWRLWPFSSKKQEANRLESSQGSENGNGGVPGVDGRVVVRRRRRKLKMRSLNPTSEWLSALDLQEGKNQIKFTFITNVLGKQEVDATLFLWQWDSRIVISDIDGTITKSDVLGQVMPLVGKDWSQSGVASLFSSIKENGYRFLYLSARAISQATITRRFLENIKQDGQLLPDGPVVISPDGLIPSLYREVIRRTPHEFKIACLNDIRSLFPPDSCPFYAGFGNRDTDEISYMAVGVPKGKIFIVNPRGEVYANSSIDVRNYTSMNKLVDDMFPPVSNRSEKEDFNSWNFWKMPLPDIDDDALLDSKEAKRREDERRRKEQAEKQALAKKREEARKKDDEQKKAEQKRLEGLRKKAVQDKGKEDARRKEELKKREDERKKVEAKKKEGDLKRLEEDGKRAAEARKLEEGTRKV